jgi:hypothetical protein
MTLSYQLGPFSNFTFSAAPQGQAHGQHEVVVGTVLFGAEHLVAGVGDLHGESLQLADQDRGQEQARCDVGRGFAHDQIGRE